MSDDEEDPFIQRLRALVAEGRIPDDVLIREDEADVEKIIENVLHPEAGHVTDAPKKGG